MTKPLAEVSRVRPQGKGVCRSLERSVGVCRPSRLLETVAAGQVRFSAG